MAKKRLLVGFSILSLFALLVLSTFVLACGQQAPAPAPAPPAAPKASPAPSPPAAAKPAAPSPAAPVAKPSPPAGEKWPDAVSVGTPTSTGAAFIRATSQALMIQKYIGITSSPQVLGGAAAVANNIGSGKLEMGFVPAANTMDAYYGEGPQKGKPIKDLRILYGGPSSIYPVVVLADSDIKSIPDLKGKKVMYLRSGNPFMKQVFELYLEAYGMTVKDITPLEWQEHETITNGLDTGTLAAGCSPLTIVGASPAHLELSQKKPIRLLDIPKDKLEYVVSKLGAGVSVDTMPGGLYKGTANDILTVTQQQIMLTTKNLPEGLAYQVLKVIWDEHRPEFVGYHAANKYMAPDKTAEIVNVIPFHPGTIKYLKEKGLWNEKLQAMHDKLLAK